MQHFPLNLPGFVGLNSQAKGAVLGPEWATVLRNSVIDGNNRVASRKGWSAITSSGNAMSGQIVQMAECYFSGARHVVATTSDNKFWRSTNGGSTWSDVTGSATVSDPNMQLVVFDNVIVGFQDGAAPVQWNGTALSNLSGTNNPQGGIGLAAFGRLWATTSDPLVIRYCALLTQSDWSGADTGVIDLTSVVGSQDAITAIAQSNNFLVIFTRKHIVLYQDGSGSELGIDPANIQVSDIVVGIGCVARDSVAAVKGDLWFLDDTGVHSLGRVIQEKSNPIDNISKNVQDELAGYVALIDPSTIRAAYSPADRFYLLSLPLGSGTSETGVAYAFDTRGQLEDGAFRCMGIWDSMVPKAILVSEDLGVYFAWRKKQGRLGQYTGYLDDTSTYVFDFESGWTDLNSPYLKILKRLTALLYIQTSTTVVFKWAFNFEDVFKTASAIYPGASGDGEWGSSEFDVAEWGGGVNIREKAVGGRGSGEYVKVGLTVNIDGDQVSCQQMALYAKQGRLV
jgi:hypothetical protein